MNIDVFPTIPRIYTAIAQWLSVMIIILVYRRNWRMSKGKLFMTAGLGLALLSAELVLTASLPVLFWVPAMLAAAALMYGILIICCDVPTLTAGYSCIRAFLISELMASLAWQLYYYSFYVGQTGVEHGDLVAVVLVFGLGTLFFHWVERRCCQEGRADQVQLREFLAVTFIGIASFAISNLSFVTNDTPFTSQFATEIYNIRTLVDLGGLAILYVLYIQHRELKIRYERDSIQNVLETQYVQYRQYRESIELIDRKYHDLKHQIAALRAETDAERRKAWLDAMESDIAVYEAQNKTGNSVLDTVLTGKSLYCQKHQINLTCVADGSLLEFMDVMDICTIFGNALDNAIEAVLEIKDKEKRLIHCSLSAQKEFILIRVENYYEGSLTMKDGIPQSTKGDDRFHGFGVKSIRHSVRKYGGSISITNDRNWFDLKMLIPMNSSCS